MELTVFVIVAMSFTTIIRERHKLFKFLIDKLSETIIADLPTHKMQLYTS